MKYIFTYSVEDLSSYHASIIRNGKNEITIENYLSNYEKEKDPIYSLIKVDFNKISRKAKVYFNESKEYRTVERYVQRNYKKFPIYSNWKIRSKTISKSLKLTNGMIEKLNKNEDNLIRIFANEIVCNLNSNDLLPSWFKKKTLNTYYEKEKKDEIEYRMAMKIEYENNLTIENRHLDKINDSIRKIDKKKVKYSKKLLKFAIKINKINSNKKNIPLGILTIGVYFYLKSNRHLIALEKRSKKLVDSIKTIDLDLKKSIDDKKDVELDITKINDDEANSILVHKKMLQKLLDIYREKYNSIIPLGEECINYKGFISLKSFSGYNYKKIVGCYVILNNELNKYYVGQSKDIMHRLRQHFKGTVPNNIIFAKDYLSSKLKNKENIFSVKIIPLKTKDQLDTAEKSLIEKYDAYDSGYNRTSGNI